MGQQRTYRVGISGSYGGLNLGDEAILRGIVTSLRAILPVEITVFGRDSEDTLARHGVERAVTVRSLARDEVAPEVERLDLFILGGGGVLYDADARTYLRELQLAQAMGVPTMVYAVSAGPLRDTTIQGLVAEALEAAGAVTVREPGAKKTLEEIGVRREIVVTADPAFLIEPEPVPDDVPVREHLDRPGRVVGVSVREPGVAAPDLQDGHYHRLLANAADFIIERYDAKVLFVPMERRRHDTQHSHAVISQMLRAERAWVLKGAYSEGQVLGLMSRLDLAVGMRLHFLIFAALERVPFVALPYSAKVTGLLEMMGIETPPVDLVNEGRLLAHIDRAWDTRDEIRAKIDEVVPRMRERALATARIAEGLLVGGRP